jgi:phosphopantothenoylcysteine decarboxylase/phosphopantothenate--cysteine ligase
VPPPLGVSLMRVETTDEMMRAVACALPRADVLVMAAAPADFRAASPAAAKIKRSGGVPSIELAPTADILAETVAHRRDGAIVVGFALETHDLVASARAKLQAKRLDLIVANPAGEPGAGFEADTNRVTLIGRDGSAEALPLSPKTEIADIIIDRVGALLDAR